MNPPSPATQMFTKSVDLLHAAELLYHSHHDHATYVCAIHAGINAADAIGHYENDTYSGLDHRGAADHLRSIDVTLSKPAQALRRLADSKSAVEYREARFTRNQTADALRDATVLVSAAAEWMSEVYTPAYNPIGGLSSLILAIERDAQRENLPINRPPWSITLAVLTALASRDITIEQLLTGE